MTLDRVKFEFSDPGNEFRFAPFWFLNHRLEDEELRWQIQEMNRNGVGGFILHARHGLLTPYLSGEWFERIECTIKEAERLGMKAYLYDENNWPSGTANAKVIEDCPERRMSGAYLSETYEVKGGDHCAISFDPQDGLIGVVAVPVAEDGAIRGFPECYLDLAPYTWGNKVDWDAAAGNDWKVLVFTRRFLIGRSFFGGALDTLNKDAVARFIELTHKEYAKRFGQYFGNVVMGIFTDEPSMNYNPPEAIAWTPSLPAEFTWRTGYDLITALPLLLLDIDSPEAIRIRCDYYETITDLYHKAFYKQIYDYCDEVRLNSIGHPLFEGEFLQHIRHQGDLTRAARYLHFGGVDFLCELCWPEEEGHLNNLMGPKYASSAAHLYGKPRVMSECFGLASQWGIDLRNLKWMSDWQVALGVNLLEPHAFYYSIQGLRKWECPPGEFYQSPFWRYYKILADYIGRLCSLFSGGKHKAQVAVLSPAKSMWANLDPGNNPTVEAIVRDLERTCTGLLRTNFDFDFVGEEQLQEACVLDDGRLAFFKDGILLEAFEVLVLPRCITLSKRTVAKIKEFYDEGGKLIAIGALTDSFAEAGKDEELREAAKAIFDKGDSACLIPDTEPVGKFEEELGEALGDLVDPEVTIETDGKPIGDIIYLHYLKEGADFYLFVNSSRTVEYEADINVKGGGVPQLWEAVTGETKPLYRYKLEKDRFTTSLRFEPTQSYIIALVKGDTPLHITDTDLEIECLTEGKVFAVTPQKGDHFIEFKDGDKESQRKEVKVAEILEPITLGKKWKFCIDKPNALPLREWNYRIEAQVLGRDNCAEVHIYEASFTSEIEDKQAKLLLDGLAVDRVWRGSAPIDFTLTFNNKKAEFKRGEYLDHYIEEADIEIRKGENKITIRTSGHLYDTPSLTYPVVIVGNFALGQGKKVLKPYPQEIEVGSWAGQGYPFYSGIGTYEQTVEIPKEYLKRKLVLELESVGDMAAVSVNGQEVAVLPWEPFKADISEYVKEGKNTITIKVANALQNLLIGEPKPSGILGEVKIVAYEKLEMDLD